MGNMILHIVVSMHFCFEHNMSFIVFEEIPFFYKKNVVYLNDRENESHYSPDTSNMFHVKRFWEYDFTELKLHKHKDKIRDVLLNAFSFFTSRRRHANTTNSLHIHIRSGDIFKKNGGNGMVQPPCIYYEDEINKHKWDKVIIASENDANPCTNYLVKKYVNVFYFRDRSLQSDIRTLVSASNVMTGRGTFMPSLSLFMIDLKTIHYLDDGDANMDYFIKTFHTGKYIRHTEYKRYYEEIQKMGGWNYDERIGELMLNFRKT